LTSLEGIENLNSLAELYCGENKLTSLEEIKNLNSFEKLDCLNNQLTSLEGIEHFIKLIKNNKYNKNNIMYNFIDTDDYVELNNLFENLIEILINFRINIEDNKLIEKIEQMICELKELNKLKGFEKYVLK
jgi:nitrate/nitrite-specific signal transduction histidine kinase